MSLHRRNRSLFRRRLTLEPLESRRVLTSFNVNTLLDVTDAGDGVTTLREAIALAASDPNGDFDDITITVPGTIRLTQGDLSPTTSLTISGYFQEGVTKIQTTIDAHGASRIFEIDGGTQLVLSALHLTGGHSLGPSGPGGAILVLNSVLVVSACWIEGNTSNYGGAIYLGGDSDVLVGFSTLSGNGNTADSISSFDGGGAIVSESSGTLYIINSTISGNATTNYGGGLFLLGSGETNITNSTIVLNRADSKGDSSGAAGAGGIAVNAGVTVTLNNSIVAGNVHGSLDESPIDISSPVSGKNNIIGSAERNPLPNGVNGNIVGLNGAGNLNVEAIIHTGLRRTGTYAPFHALVPGSPAVDGGSNALAINENDEPLTSDQRGEGRIRNGDALGTATVDIGAVEIAAPSLNVGGNVSFTENGSTTLLASAGTISDADSTNLGGGLLVVSITRNAQDGDTLSVRHQGTGAGQIGVSGRYIKYAGAIIGSFSGGAGDPLIIRLNANATLAKTQALLRNIGYRHIGETPSALPRTIAFACEDGDGGVAFRRFKSLSVTPVNDAPKLTGATTRNYTLNGASVVLTPNATVTDADSANFADGTLRVAIVSGDSSANRLLVGGSFTRTGDDIFVGTVKIGTVTASGSGLNDLVIKFTSAATTSIVQVVRAIKFKTVSGTIKAQQLINFTVTDGDGGTSNTVQVTLNVN